MKYLKSSYLLLLMFVLGSVSCSTSKTSSGQNSFVTLNPGEVWTDNNGNHIQAHGGGIIKIKDTWFWFGEYRGKDAEVGFCYVGCYSSKDLSHWTFLNKIKFSAPDGFGEGWILERPKVYYNSQTGKYVMYVHLDDKDYKKAEVGIAVSDRADSGYHFVNHFRPFGMESRDIGQFIDDDGTAYLIFESRPTHGFVIARLSNDYLSLDKKESLVQEAMEGGAIVHYQGLYYVVGSHLTGWRANPNVFATARTLEGPWSEFKGIAPDSTNTYGSQSSNLIKVEGTEKTTIIYVGDIWKPDAQWDSRYLWMPVEIGDSKLWLPKPQPWSLNIKTGNVQVGK